MTSLAVFRADGSTAMGGGHLSRCLALADGLSSRGWECMFLTDRRSAEVASWKSRCRHPVQWLDGDKRSTMGDRPCDLLIVDGYDIDLEQEQQFRSYTRRIVAIDDLATRPHDCDILVDQNFGRTALDYAALVADTCEVLAGPLYALIRDEFRRHRRPAATGVREDIKQIFICLGSHAPGSQLDAVVAGIAEAGLDRCVLDIAPKDGDGDLPRRMAEADVAITAGGVTLIERCCIGTPGIAIVRAENQTPGVRSAAGQGAALGIGLAGSWGARDLARALTSLAPREVRQRMSAAAAQLCDGLGIRRVLLYIDPERTETGQSVILRPAGVDDARAVYGWQCQPGGRVFSRDPGIPSWDEHVRWFESKLAAPGTLLNIVIAAGRPAGVLRLDRMADAEDYEVSILISADHQRQGLGAAALRAARRLVADSGCRAFIKGANVSSLKLFKSAGFVGIGNDWYAIAPLSRAA